MEKGIKAIGCLFLSPFIISGTLFPIIGIILVITGIGLEIKRDNDTENYIETKGYYINSTYVSTDEDGTRFYELNYEYTVNGEKFVVSTDYSTNNVPNIGEEETIRYNSENPNEAVIISNTFYKILIFIGVIFIVISCIWIFPIVFVAGFAKHKNKEKIKMMNNDSNIENNKELNEKIVEDDNDDPIKNL